MLMSVIFDMDGVIVDSHAAHIRTWKKALLSLGKSVTDADLESVRQGRKKQEILHCLMGDVEDEQVRILCHQKDMLFRREAESIKMIPGAYGLLDELNRAGIPTALASCGSTARVHHLLSRLRIIDYV